VGFSSGAETPKHSIQIKIRIQCSSLWKSDAFQYCQGNILQQAFPWRSFTRRTEFSFVLELSDLADVSLSDFLKWSAFHDPIWTKSTNVRENTTAYGRILLEDVWKDLNPLLEVCLQCDINILIAPRGQEWWRYTTTPPFISSLHSA
jgi:hypothetical protein